MHIRYSLVNMMAAFSPRQGSNSQSLLLNPFLIWYRLDNLSVTGKALAEKGGWTLRLVVGGEPLPNFYSDAESLMRKIALGLNKWSIRKRLFCTVVSFVLIYKLRARDKWDGQLAVKGYNFTPDCFWYYSARWSDMFVNVPTPPVAYLTHFSSASHNHWTWTLDWASGLRMTVDAWAWRMSWW